MSKVVLPKERIKQLLEWLDDLHEQTSEAIGLNEILNDVSTDKINVVRAIDFNELYLYAFPPILDLLHLNRILYQTKNDADALTEMFWADWYDPRMIRFFMVLKNIFEDYPYLRFTILPPYKDELDFRLRKIDYHSFLNFQGSAQAQLKESLREFLGDEKIVNIFKKKKNAELPISEVLDFVKQKYTTLNGLFGLTSVHGVKTLQRILDANNGKFFYLGDDPSIAEIDALVDKNKIKQAVLEPKKGFLDRMSRIRPGSRWVLNNYNDAWALQYVIEFNTIANEKYRKKELSKYMRMLLVSSTASLKEFCNRYQNDKNSSDIEKQSNKFLVIHPSSLFLSEIFRDKTDGLTQLSGIINKISDIKSYIKNDIKETSLSDNKPPEHLFTSLENVLKEIRFGINMTIVAKNRSLIQNKEKGGYELLNNHVQIPKIISLINNFLTSEEGTQRIESLIDEIIQHMKGATSELLDSCWPLKFNTLPQEISYIFPFEDKIAYTLESQIFNSENKILDKDFQRGATFLKAWSEVEQHINEQWEYPLIAARVYKKIHQYEKVEKFIDLAKKLSIRDKEQKELSEKKIGFIEVMFYIRKEAFEAAFALSQDLLGKYGKDTARFDLQGAYIKWRQFMTLCGSKINNPYQEEAMVLLNDAIRFAKNAELKLHNKEIAEKELPCILITYADLCICYAFLGDLDAAEEYLNKLDKQIENNTAIVNKFQLPLYIYSLSLVHLLEAKLTDKRKDKAEKESGKKQSKDKLIDDLKLISKLNLDETFISHHFFTSVLKQIGSLLERWRRTNHIISKKTLP